MKKIESKNNEDEMSVYELSVLMMKQFTKLEDFKEEARENFRLVNKKIGNMAEEQQKISEQLKITNDKANNAFYISKNKKTASFWLAE